MTYDHNLIHKKLNLVLISQSPPATESPVATYNVQWSVSVSPRRTCDGSSTYSNFWNLREIRTIFNNSSCKYGSRRLTGVRWVRRWCSHKIFPSPTAASLPAKLNWVLTSQASRRPIMIRRYMLNTCHVLAIAAHRQKSRTFRAR